MGALSWGHMASHNIEARPATALELFRRARGLTRSLLAERAGVHRETVARLEREENAPCLDTARALAAVLEIAAPTIFPVINDERRPSEAGAVKEPRRQARHDAG